MKRILFPSDGSEASIEAFKQLIPLAVALNAEVILFHNYALLSVTRSEALDACETQHGTLDEIEAALKAKGREWLEAQAHRLEAAGIPSELVQARGHTGELIIETADKRAIDWIVLGSRSLNSIDSFLLGSTSLYVLHNSTCPVLVIPVAQAEHDRQ